MDEKRLRDDVIARELSRAFHARGTAAGGPHLDAEEAAAWMERRLDTAASLSVEAHLASCTDCQAIVATLARIAPELADAESAGWWSRLRLPWLVPAAATAAAALVIWTVVPQREPPLPQLESTQALSVAPVEPVTPAAPDASQFTPLEAARAARPADQAKREGDATASEQRRNPTTPLAAPTAPQLRERRDAQAAAALESAAPPVQAAEPSADRLPVRVGGAAGAPDALVVAEAPTVDAQTARKVTVSGATPAAPPPARQEGAPALPRALNDTAAISALSRAVELIVVAADGTGRWRRAGMAIEFSAGANAPFAAATLPLDASTITAGSSPAGRVCWLVGRAGAVVVTTDGVRFARVSAPVAADLVSVAATDARSAIVTSADGRRFRTGDRGETWSAVP